MMRSVIADNELRRLVEHAGARPMTPAERERQLVSFAFGNAKIENNRVTRASVEQAVARMALRSR